MEILKIFQTNKQLKIHTGYLRSDQPSIYLKGMEN